MGLTHLKGSKVAFDNLGRGADKSEGGFDSYNGTHNGWYISIPHYIDVCSGRGDANT